MSKFSMRIVSKRFNTASSKTQEVCDGTPQSNKQKFAGCEMDWVRSLFSWKQHATSYDDIVRINVVSSDMYSMPKVEANALELEEKNGGHSPEVSYTPAPAVTSMSSPLRWILYTHLALKGLVGVAADTGLLAVHPEDSKSLWWGDNEALC